MEDTIYIQLLDIYKPVTEADIQTGKNYVLRRESAARGLSSLVDSLLKDAAEQITRLCYVYNIDPKGFSISYKYNEKLFEQISAILDQLEDEIFDLMLEYAMKCTESEKRRHLLLPWILALGRNNKTLRTILQNRLWMFSRDLEAMIATAKMAELNQSKAISIIKSNLHTVYQMPGMTAAFANSHLFQATYIRSKGVKHGNVGNSSSEANNIGRYVRMTVQKAWMRNQYYNYQEKGAAGYYVLRGSNYPCPLCESFVGFHPIEDFDSMPPFHGNCCCYTVPIFNIND